MAKKSDGELSRASRRRVVAASVRSVASSMIVNFLFVPYYPVWSLLIIALNVFVIWALCVFNRDAAASL